MNETDDRHGGRPDDDWQVDWEGHRRWQLTATLESTPAERLAWLEEMLELTRKLARLHTPGG